jgi:hypothetical protein
LIGDRCSTEPEIGELIVTGRDDRYFHEAENLTSLF